MRMLSGSIQGAGKMGREISQYDISDRQLLADKAQPKAGVWTDIGEAEITYTMFGRARVRLIREHDKISRGRWLTALVVTALVAAAWLGWVASQPTEPLPSAVLPTPLSAAVQAAAPASQVESILPEATTAGSAPGALQPLSGQKAAEPTAAQPLIAIKPQTAPLATSDTAAKTQAVKKPPPKRPFQNQPVAPAVVTPGAVQPAGNRPATVMPLDAPLIDEDTPLPAGGN
jgi:hypothetical protein